MCLMGKVLFFVLKLEYSCCTMLYYFLLYNEVNQLYVYIYLLPLGPPSHSIPQPNCLGHHRAASWAPWAIQQLPTRCLAYTQKCIYVSAVLSVHRLLSCLCPWVCSLHRHLCSCPRNKFVCTIFLDSTYMHSYRISVFVFLTYFA